MTAAALELDRAFHALANATRRAVVARLMRGPASVSELSAPFRMSLPSFLQHLRILERGGLVTTSKEGRVRTVAVVPERLDHAATWLDRQRQLWERRLQQLDDHLKSL